MTTAAAIARAAQTTAAHALRAVGLGGPAAAAHLHRAARLAAAAYDLGATVAQVHPRLTRPRRRDLAMPATASTTAPIPAPRQPADGPLAEQQHLLDEACNPQMVDAFRALAGRA